MPPGRDSFRRNRVAPNYNIILALQTTGMLPEAASRRLRRMQLSGSIRYNGFRQAPSSNRYLIVL